MTAFKQQLPDANQQLLVSCFAHQGIFTGPLSQFTNDPKNLLPEDVAFKTLDITYRIHKEQEHNIKLIAASRLTLKEEDTPVYNMKMHIALDLIALTGEVSYTVTPL